jgi:hypothetical protein
MEKKLIYMEKNSISKLEEMLKNKGINAKRAVRTTGIQDDLFMWAVYSLNDSYTLVLHDLNTHSGTTEIGTQDTYSKGLIISPETKIQTKLQLKDAKDIAEHFSVELDVRPYQKHFLKAFAEPQNAMIALERVRKAHVAYSDRFSEGLHLNY